MKATASAASSTEGFACDRELMGEIVSAMSQVPLFAGLRPDQRLEVARQGDLVYFEPRQRLFRQGDAGDEIHIILDGDVQLISADKDLHKVVSIKRAGSSFGEISFMSGAPRALTAIAGPRGAFDLTLSRRTFERVAAGDPAIGLAVLRELMGGVEQRMKTLPPSFRNYLMWGYRPAAGDLRPDAGTWRFPLDLLAILAGVISALFALAGPDLLAWIRHGFAGPAPLGGSRVSTSLGIGAIAGALLAQVAHALEGYRRRHRAHARSCANCKFVQWDQTTGAASCRYTNEGLRHAPVRPGARFDTYTDCPSFELDGLEPPPRAMNRDSMSKD